MSIRGKLAVILNRRNINIPQQLIDELVNKYGAHSWFGYIVKERAKRWDLWRTSFWLASNLSADAAILETGCGTATNLIWFGQQGFHKLYGLDIDEDLLGIANELSQKTNIDIKVWQDDGLNPKKIPNIKFDAILAVNWTFLLEEYELEGFLQKYVEYLSPHGYIAIDVIDRSYDQVKDNQYLSSDLQKPEKERKQSEYRKRYTFEEVVNAADKVGMKIAQNMYDPEDRIPKHVYILKKQD